MKIASKFKNETASISTSNLQLIDKTKRIYKIHLLGKHRFRSGILGLQNYVKLSFSSCENATTKEGSSRKTGQC